MKKLVFLFVAFAAISFASCGNKTAQGAATDSDSVANVDSAADSANVDSAAMDSAAATTAPADSAAAQK